MTPLTRLCVTSVTIAGLAFPAAAAHAGPRATILSGPLHGGGTWTLAAERSAIGSLRALCLHLGATFPDGSSPGTGTGCAAGSLRARHSVFTVTESSHAGATQTSYLIGGVTVSRARTVRIFFADGKRLRLRTSQAPRTWRRALGTRVRYFGGDALAVTGAKVRRVSAYDRRGRRIANSRTVQGT